MIITLIGFMGTGKSTVGKMLAKRIGFDYLDTDSEIEKNVQLEISDIFNMFGEEYFRDQESAQLLRAIESDKNQVISTGGGIVISPFNRELLKEKTVPILLQASPEEIYNRVKDDENRPLLAVTEPKKEINRLLTKRARYYNKFKTKINTDNRSVEDIVDEIIKIIKHTGDD